MPEQPHDSATIDRPSDVQHGVAAKSSLLWPLLDPDPNYLVDGRPLTAAVLLRYRFLDGTPNQHRAVKSTIETLEKPQGVPFFVTWEDCANVKFQEVHAPISAEIRITFKAEAHDIGADKKLYWSAVGNSSMVPAQYPSQKPSMNLSPLPDQYPPSDSQRGNILHEFGHALGLRHEHQSPAFEGVVNFNEDKVIEYFGNNYAFAGQNVLNKLEEPINYTRFDKHSIMVYTILPEWQKTRLWQTPKLILANQKLSELDQAFIRLMYPPDLSEVENREPFLKAMITAGIDKKTAGFILSDSLEIQGSAEARLTAMRNRFNTYKDGLLLFRKSNKLFSRGIDPASLRQSGVNGFIGEVTQNKLFQGITRNIVHRAKEQYGIPTNVSLPGRMHNEVMNMLGALAMRDDVARTVKYYNNQLRGESGFDDLPPSKTPDKTPEIRTDPGTEKPSVNPSDKLHDGLPLSRIPDKTPNTVASPDLDEWSKGAGGKDSARLRKSPSGETFTIELLTLQKKVLIAVNEECFGTDVQHISECLDAWHRWHVDVKGTFHYKARSTINTGSKAKWIHKRIAFYRGDWKSDNIVACFSPSDVVGLSLTEFPSMTADFENVKWE